MNTKTVWIALAVVALIAIGGWFALFKMSAPAAPVSDTATTTNPGTTGTSADTAAAPSAQSDGAASIIVSYSDDGFYPKSVTVRAGDTVRFVNQSTHGMWVGADEHPTHTEYDGTSTREHCADGVATNGTFDQCASSANGSAFEYTFMKAGTFGYHNHTRAANTGSVIVQ